MRKDKKAIVEFMGEVWKGDSGGKLIKKIGVMWEMLKKDDPIEGKGHQYLDDCHDVIRDIIDVDYFLWLTGSVTESHALYGAKLYPGYWCFVAVLFTEGVKGRVPKVKEVGFERVVELLEKGGIDLG